MSDLMTRDEIASLLEAASDAKVPASGWAVSAEWQACTEGNQRLHEAVRRIAATALAALDEAARLQTALEEARQHTTYLREQLLTDSANMDKLLFLNGSLEAATETLQAWVSSQNRRPDRLRALLERLEAASATVSLSYVPGSRFGWLLVTGDASPNGLHESGTLAAVVASACEKLEAPHG